MPLIKHTCTHMHTRRYNEYVHAHVHPCTHAQIVSSDADAQQSTGNHKPPLQLDVALYTCLVHAHLRSCAHARIDRLAARQVHTYACGHVMHKYEHMFLLYKHAQMHTHACMHARTHTRMHARTHARTRTHAHIHKHTHTHTHTHWVCLHTPISAMFLFFWKLA